MLHGYVWLCSKHIYPYIKHIDLFYQQLQVYGYLYADFWLTATE